MKLENEKCRRIGLMQQVTRGINSCVRVEHEALYRLIRTHCPDEKFTTNRNGVFVPLKRLPTHVLQQCCDLIKHGQAQMEKEQTRQQREDNLTHNLKHNKGS